jgi:serine/threonine protein kinase/tetratricopeptide (TPR) repeat protein
MGEVYRAHDARLGRDIALKVLPAHLSRDPEMRARFEHEARAIAALSHENVMSIHELAVINGEPVAVVELLEGESLRTRLARGPMPWREAVQMAARIADGLAAAHAKGIIHRDLKPENIFVTEDQRPKILDFGLAHSEHFGPLGASDLTRGVTEPGRMMGTIGYMSPEQVRGERVGAPTDIFAFGCTLAEMLTGQRPFAHSTAAETLAAVLHEPAPNLLSSGLDIPPRLSEIVAHCLEKDPARRFASARDVSAALRALLVESTSSGVSGPVRRNRRKRAVAVLPFTSLDADQHAEYLADGVTESIINSLSQLDKIRVVPRSTVFAYKGRPVNPRSVGLALNVDVIVSGRVVQQDKVLNVQAELVDVVHETQLWGDQYRHPMADLLALQEQIAWQISEALRVQLTGQEKKRLKRKLQERPTDNSDAYHEYLRGRHEWGKWTPAGFQAAVRHFEAAIAKDAKYARAYSGLGDTYGVIGYYGYLPPEIAMTRAASAAYKALELDPTLAEAHATMGVARMFFYWDWIGAEVALRKAIELDPRYPNAHMLLGLLYSIVGRHDEAVAAGRRGRELDPLSLVTQMGVTWTLYFARKFREAMESLREVTAIDPAFPEALSMLAWLYEQLGLFERSADVFNQPTLMHGAFGADAGERLHRALQTGGVASYWRERLALLREADDRAAQTPGGHRCPSYAYAIVHSKIGDFDSACAALERAVSERAGHAVFMQAEPAFDDAIRRDPRFEALIRRMGYPAPALP